MSTKVKSPLVRDDRPIKSIYWDDAEGTNYVVGSSGVTKIVPYEEYGIGDITPWLAVYVDERIVCRVAAWKVTICY